ncbi:hypothetical protein Hanom_Chr07g00673141 [Helianthus anomalus]
MASSLKLLFLLTATYSFIFSNTLATDSNDLKAFPFSNTIYAPTVLYTKVTYIVYMGDLPKTHFSVASLHSNMLQEVTGRFNTIFMISCLSPNVVLEHPHGGV